MNLPNSYQIEKKLAAAKAKSIWMQAYRDGAVTFTFSDTTNGLVQAATLYKFLCNSRTKAKNKPLANVKFLQIVADCRLSRPKPFIVHIWRKTLHSQALHAYTILNNIEPDQNKKAEMPSIHSILQKFKKTYLNTCTKT